MEGASEGRHGQVVDLVHRLPPLLNPPRGQEEFDLVDLDHRHPRLVLDQAASLVLDLALARLHTEFRVGVHVGLQLDQVDQACPRQLHPRPMDLNRTLDLSLVWAEHPHRRLWEAVHRQVLAHLLLQGPQPLGLASEVRTP